MTNPDLTRASDAVGCIRGTKVQNILGAPTADYVSLVEGCELFAGPTRAACYRWLGKTIAVLTNGRFETAGCPQLEAPSSREQCRAGAREMDGPLETFS